MNPLIGLMGAAGAGKNTVGEILLRAGWQQMAFADPLRDGLAAMLWLPTECYVSRKEQPIEWLGGATPRMLMQTLGTEWVGIWSAPTSGCGSPSGGWTHSSVPTRSSQCPSPAWCSPMSGSRTRPQ